MSLNLPDDASCFVDANILCYHFIATPGLSEPCSDFLERVAGGGVNAYTSVHVLAEAMHKIMIAEAASRFGISRAGLVPWLQAHPERMAELGEFEQEVRELCAITMTCLPMDVGLLQSAAECSIRFRLLTNDAIIVGLMRRHDLTHLVTNDDDLDRVPGLTIWKPRTA